jgi:hypothetical protein
MSRRLSISAFLYLVGVIVYLSISRANIRVHIVTIISWTIVTALLAFFLWQPRLKLPIKIALLVGCWGLSAMLIEYIQEKLIFKQRFSWRVFFAYLILLVILYPIFFSLVFVINYLTEKWRPKNPRETDVKS